jgi:hypothetical protein
MNPPFPPNVAERFMAAQPLLPAVSFLGGFQTPAGPEKACALPSGRHLKPITSAEVRLISKSGRY